MKVKVLSCFLMLLSAACDERNSMQELTSDKWNISWHLNDNVTTGTIYLSENNEATVIISEADHFFFSKPQQVEFQWSIDDQRLSLIRKDNGFVMDYTIEEKKSDLMKLSYEDLKIKIFR